MLVISKHDLSEIERIWFYQLSATTNIYADLLSLHVSSHPCAHITVINTCWT